MAIEQQPSVEHENGEEHWRLAEEMHARWLAGEAN